MTKVTELMGPQITTLYTQRMTELATLRQERANINDNIRELVEEVRELRKYVRLFNPQILDGDEPLVPPAGTVVDNGHE